MSTAIAKRKDDADVQVAPVPASETAAIFSMIERIISDPTVGIERVNQAFDFYQKVQADGARKAFDAAMAAAKAEFPQILKNRVVDFTTQKGRTNYRHEDLGEIAKTIDPILGKHGLSYRFRTSAELNEPVRVTCIVSHRLGHFEENTLPGPRDDTGNKNSLQAIGSTITYLQRYTLKSALGLAASHDDDGKSADQTADILAPITDQQQEELRSLITDTKTDITKFLTYAKAESLSDVLAKDFPKLKAFLVAKKNGGKR